MIDDKLRGIIKRAQQKEWMCANWEDDSDEEINKRAEATLLAIKEAIKQEVTELKWSSKSSHYLRACADILAKLNSKKE